MWNRFKQRYGYPGLGLLAVMSIFVVSTFITDRVGSQASAPSYQAGLDCAARLSNPAPLTTPDREWLERCVSAFTLPTTAPPTTTPPSTTPPATTPPPTTSPAMAWPNPSNTGVPAFWQPVTTRSTDLVVTSGNVTLQDVLFTNGADLIVRGGSVTVNRSLFRGGIVNNRPGSVCAGLTLNQVTFRRPSGTVTDADQEGTVRYGGYTADRVFMDGVTEGFRDGGCGTTTIRNTFVRVRAPDTCQDWHGDGIQGYGGGPLVLRNVTVDFAGNDACGGGTAPVFYPRNQGNTSLDADRLLVSGGGYSFRDGMPGLVTGLKIVSGSWFYGPIDVRCSVITTWEAQIVTVDAAWQPTNIRAQPCSTEDGS